MDKKELGYRGYVGSRSYSGIDFPQNVQNLLVRNYCQKYQLAYLLSATEYIMPGCYMILEEVVDSIQSLNGIVLFSLFMLPESAKHRQQIYERVLGSGRTLHAALEDIAIKTWSDVPMIENILDLNQIALTDRTIPTLKEFCTV